MVYFLIVVVLIIAGAYSAYKLIKDESDNFDRSY